MRHGSSIPFIDFNDVTIEFTGHGGKTTAIREFSTQINRGEFVSLVGPSGCGKSTILRTIAGLVVATEGSVSVGGQRPGEYIEAEPIGYSFQEVLLFEWRTALQNVLLPSVVAGESFETASTRAKDLLSKVGLSDRFDAFPRELSGGMKQRVALCRSLILEPQLVLLDEAFSSVDSITRESLWLDVRRLWVDSGATLCLATHSIEEAVFLSDRVLVFSSHPGTVVADIKIELGQERDLDTLTDPSFHDFTSIVRRALRK